MACHDDLRALAGLPQTVKQQTRCSGMKCNFGLLNTNQRHARSGAVSRLKQRDKNSQRAHSAIGHIRSKETPGVLRPRDLLAEFQSFFGADYLDINALNTGDDLG